MPCVAVITAIVAPSLLDPRADLVLSHAPAPGTEPRPVTIHIPDAAVNNRHVNDNWHERHNGDT